MRYQSSKLKAQSSREAPTADPQLPMENGDGSWREEGEQFTPLLLHDVSSGSDGRPPWNLEERVSVFGEQIVRFSKEIPRSPTNNRLIGQLVGAGTSVGANYCEANEAVSKKDFTNTVSRSMKEAKETKFFLRMIAASEPQLADQARALYREAHELLRILGSMRHK